MLCVCCVCVCVSDSLVPRHEISRFSHPSSHPAVFVFTDFTPSHKHTITTTCTTHTIAKHDPSLPACVCVSKSVRILRGRVRAGDSMTHERHTRDRSQKRNRQTHTHTHTHIYRNPLVAFSLIYLGYEHQILLPSSLRRSFAGALISCTFYLFFLHMH